MRTLLVLLVLTSSAFAQRPPDLAITSEERSKLLEKTAELISSHYVDPKKGAGIATALRDAAAKPPISTINSALDLVPAVNRVLKANGGDQHLRFGYSHEPQRETDENSPEEKAARLREAARNAFGIGGTEILAGNVGLLTWKKFHDPAVAGEAVMAAMRILSSSDSMIIDLRKSDGGSPHMVALLVSCFIDSGDPILLTEIENRLGGVTEQYWSASYLPVPRYTAKDVFILTSRRTFSAGEGFTEQMRRHRNATVVGETTRGGARLSRWMEVHPHFAISVSVARHVGATKEWEGTGITPDVVSTEDEALRAAHRMAVERLHARSGDEETRAGLQAILSTLTPSSQ